MGQAVARSGLVVAVSARSLARPWAGLGEGGGSAGAQARAVGPGPAPELSRAKDATTKVERHSRTRHHRTATHHTTSTHCTLHHLISNTSPQPLHHPPLRPSPTMSAPAVGPFSSLTPALHPLLLRALSTLSFTQPTPIQSTLIPLALSSNRDILARARTGSGKTLAYALPIVQSLLDARDRGEAVSSQTRALVLVPTRELAEQVRGQIGKLVDGLGLEGEVEVVNVAGDAGGRRKRKAKDSAQGERAERCVKRLGRGAFSDVCGG